MIQIQFSLMNCIIAVLAVFISGCSGSPSESAGKAVLEHRIEQNSKGAIRVVSFKKTNSQVSGNLYRLEFEAEIEFLKTGCWTKGGSTETHIEYFFSDQGAGSGAVAQLVGAVTGAVNVSQGQHQRVRDYCDFDKTEKGWRGEDGEVH